MAAPVSSPAPPARGLIELERVVKTFKNAAGEFTVLKGIDARFDEGQFVSVVGRSGSGKSTLLNMMTGIDHPTSGTVRVGDTILQTMNEGRMSVWRGRKLGIVFQFFQLLPMLTLLENVMLPMDFCDMYAPAEREPRALGLLKMVGLEGLEHKYPAGVAGGQQQSAAVARALANDPPILVADEPTGNLDSRTAERVLEIFEEQVTTRKTVLMVTHDNTLALRAQRRLVISDGELINEGLTRAFPDLPHSDLLLLHHAARPVSYPAGAPLAPRTDFPALLVVTAGALEADIDSASRLRQAGWPSLFRREAATPAPQVRFEAGEILSREDMAGWGRAISGLKAEDGTRALVVDALPESASLSAALKSTAQLRAAAQARAQRGAP